MIDIDINNVLGITIVGVGLSFLINYIKEQLGTDSNKTKLITLSLAILIGTGYWFLRGTAILQTIVGILGIASIVYAFFLKK